jgi:hypothetical protein
MEPRRYTPKQMGDACEMLVVAELTLAGVPAVKMPDGWPGYDVIAAPKDERKPQAISVKSRTFKRGGNAYVEYDIRDSSFDWLAIVLLPGEGQEGRRIFVVPRTFSDKNFHRYPQTGPSRYILTAQVDKMAVFLRQFEDNFKLSETGIAKSK